MKAELFNAKQIADGKLTDDLILKLAKSSPPGLVKCVEDWQRTHGLDVDGKAGDKETIPSLQFHKIIIPSEANLATTALQIAISEIGNGEEGANNRGPHIDRWLKGDGTGRPHDTSKMAWLWCATFVSYCFMEAAKRLDIVLPFKTSRGAKMLGRQMIAGGCVKVDPEDARPGDVFVIKRTGGHHTGFVDTQLEGGVCKTIEGNVGRFPAKVRRMQRDFLNETLIVIARCLA